MRAGEFADLGTATAWTGSSLAFEAAARRIGSLSLNFLRVTMALGWLTAAAWLIRGRALPTDATDAQWAYLATSGLVGMVLGDLCTFRAYVEFGARRTMVVSTVTPILTAALAWLFLDERVTAREGLAMAVIVGGVLLAVRERGGDPASRTRLWRGAALAAAGALGQAGGLLLSKRGLAGYSAIAGTQIRVATGVVGFALVLTLAGWWPRLRAALGDRRALGWTAIGALFGPGIGVALSLYAVSHAHTGVAASLMALPPVLVLPLVIARGEIGRAHV